MKKLSSREQTMLGVVVGIATLFAGSLMISAFRSSYNEAAEALSTRRQELRSLREVLSQSPLWSEREVWLGTHQPPLGNREEAGVELLEEVRKTARTHGLLLERPELGRGNEGAAYQAVSISVQTKSDWRSLIAFMNELQQPERFIVFEESAIRIDSSNNTQMHGQFRIARWYNR